MIEEHSFAKYIRSLGKGKRGQRSLTEEESYTATRLILDGEVEDIQLGAFLMLMRVKEETPEEIAGFIKAIKEDISLPDNIPPISVDWSSYAGKRRHLPWFVLSALLLSQNGYSVFMHGLSRDDERVYAEQALNKIGYKASQSLTEAVEEIRKTGFSYLSIQHLSPLLNRTIELRNLLGLRSPGHTISRLLNPLSARVLMQGIFHPGYAEIHQRTAQMLGQLQAAVFKGEGGEIERDPDKFAIVNGVNNGEIFTEEWPPIFNNTTRHIKDESLNLDLFKAVWDGEARHEYGEAAVISTVAIIIKALGLATSQQAAIDKATLWWSARIKSKVA